MPLLKSFMAQVREQGLHEKAFFLIGVGPLPSSKTARWMRSNVPGVHIPDAVIERMEKSKNEKAEGKQLAIDLIQEISEIEGVAGVHVMAYRQEEYVAEIVAESGVLKGRQPWKREARQDDQIVADRLDRILHEDMTERPADRVARARS